MVQQGQTFELKRCGPGGERLWAYRYRTGGRDSTRVDRGGFASEQAAREALERELERLRREQRIARRLTLAELVEVYLAQHDVQPVTIEKLRYLLSKATAVFGEAVRKWVDLAHPRRHRPCRVPRGVVDRRQLARRRRAVCRCTRPPTCRKADNGAARPSGRALGAPQRWPLAGGGPS
jgi:hypothetical protein